MSALERLRDAESADAECKIVLPHPVIEGEPITEEYVFPAGLTLDQVREKLKASFRAQGAVLVTTKSDRGLCVLVCQAANRYNASTS